VIDYTDSLRASLRQYLPGVRVEYLHGKMKSADKLSVMEQFALNRIQVLVSTTVVEVGVNVPNATVMMVENAERFGLAQLHQLRGRVGRGKDQSYCIFISPMQSEESRKRLQILASSNDGFEIAQKDLELRGPGELFGVKWRVRIDKYNPQNRIIIDWKTCADINKTEYNPILGERESFVEALGYLMRAAVYTEIEKQHTGNTEDANFVIVAVSKQDPPDKAALLLNHRQRYDYELEQIQKHMARIIDVKIGRVKPRRCGSCEYCRSTKVLKKITPYYTLNPKFREEREEEYDEAFGLEVAQA
jgi:CRISPR/Cas system-associated endonuclease/helicase Cas3